MKRSLKNLLLILTLSVLFAAVCLVPSVTAKADDAFDYRDDPDVDKYNPDTGYRVVIIDAADLFTSDEIKQLAQEMAPITAYGHAVLITTDENSYGDTQYYSEELYDDMFGYDSGTMFVIDMDERMLWIQSDGEVLKTVNRSYANTITDNSYRYASNGDYYQCASKVFSQIYTILNGGKIARPMKVICSLFMALLISFLVNYFIVNSASKIQNTSSNEMLMGAAKSLRYTTPNVVQTGQTRTYSPQSSGSSGGGGGGHRGGGGGGGHHGGGGGHRF